jgi:hypothetical protein
MPIIIIKEQCALICATHVARCELPVVHSGYCCCKRCESPAHVKRRPVGTITQSDEAKAKASIWKDWFPTIAAGDFKVSTDGGALANLTTLPVVTLDGSKMVKFSLSAAEMNGDDITVIDDRPAQTEWMTQKEE